MILRHGPKVLRAVKLKVSRRLAALSQNGYEFATNNALHKRFAAMPLNTRSGALLLEPSFWIPRSGAHSSLEQFLRVMVGRGVAHMVPFAGYVFSWVASLSRDDTKSFAIGKTRKYP